MRPSEQYELINRMRKTLPVDVEAMAEALGVDVSTAFLDADVSGMIEKVADDPVRYRILVNAYDPPTRQRFTIAHELGHYMLHRGLIGDGVDDDRAYRSTAVGKYHNTSIGPRHETEANKFAANVLMPYELIDQLKDLGVRDPNEMAQRLVVSPHAMHIRLGIPYQEPFV